VEAPELPDEPFLRMTRNKIIARSTIPPAAAPMMMPILLDFAGSSVVALGEGGLRLETGAKFDATPRDCCWLGVSCSSIEAALLMLSPVRMTVALPFINVTLIWSDVRPVNCAIQLWMDEVVAEPLTTAVSVTRLISRVARLMPSALRDADEELRSVLAAETELGPEMVSKR
jgi:hypothetical protein